MKIDTARRQLYTCILHSMHRPFEFCSLLQIFKKLILCLTNLLSSDVEQNEESSLDWIMDLFCIYGSFPCDSLQAKYTRLWLEGTCTWRIILGLPIWHLKVNSNSYTAITFKIRLFMSDWNAFHILRTTEEILTAWGSPSLDSSSTLHLMTRAKFSDLLKFLRWRIKWEGLGEPAFANSNAMSSSQGTSQIILQGFLSILSGARH